jgi:glycosyltransferase involved in cell wall biosynthesis
VKVGLYVGGWTSEAGGGFTIVSEIVKAFDRRGQSGRHSFTLLTLADGAEVRARHAGLDVLSLRDAYFPRTARDRIRRKVRSGMSQLRARTVRPTGDVPSTPAVDRLLTKEKIDFVCYLSVWDCCTLEIPFSTVVWDLQHRRQPFFPEVSGDGKWAYRERWLSTVLGRAALVVAGTEVGRQEIERFYGVPSERILLMPHPTPQFAADADSGAAPGQIQGEFLFYPAQFWPHKNHANLILALRILRERFGLDLSLVLTGSDQGNQAFVREVARQNGLADRVHFLGFVSTAELVSLYRRALALAYVTFFGPENLPPLEAFAAGCPVVASDVAGAREQLGDAALFVDPREPEQIAAAVARVHAEPATRDRLIRAGAQRAKKFTASDFTAALETWLDEFEGVRRNWPPGVYGGGKGRYP